MAKVYVVEHGEYSDRKWLGLFSTERKALDYIEREIPLRHGGSYDELRISVHEVDDPDAENSNIAPPLGEPVFKANLRGPGKYSDAARWEMYSVLDLYGTPAESMNQVHLQSTNDTYGHVFSRDRERAVKIASDWAARKNAEREGIA